MTQTRIASFVEAWGNVIIGYLVAVVANAVVLPAFGYQVSIADSFMIAVVFTLISLARSYVLRRVFNAIKWGNR